MTRPSRAPLAQRLPEFPWDSLDQAKKTAAAHNDGLVDLSVGSPVDPVSSRIQEALGAAAEYPGYPQTIGTLELRDAICSALRRRFGVYGVEHRHVLPVVGTKEAIAWLPTVLGLGADSTVVIPELAYPTYEVGARLAGAQYVRSDSTVALGPRSVALMYINSPSNPTGRVLGLEHLRKVVEWARQRDVIIASDECYLGMGWGDTAPISILHPDVCGGDFRNLLAIHSLSKTSNFASYRGGFFAGDPELIAELTLVRKHAGLMVPYPIQAAMVQALNDDTFEAHQKSMYADRRTKLKHAFLSADFRIEHSEAGLYLWATRGEHCRDTVNWLAKRGILVAPGEFYGAQGETYVRVALTASDEAVDKVVDRLQ